MQAEHVRFFETLDHVNRVIGSAEDVDEMASEVMRFALSAFDCDRTWTLCPADPDAAQFQCSVRAERPEYSGKCDMGQIPVVPGVHDVHFCTVLAASGPVTFGPGCDQELDPFFRDNYGVQSQMVMAVCPRAGKPWLFGIHQCSRPRVWTEGERRLFEAIGRRIADGISSILLLRSLQESESNYRGLVENQPVGVIIHRATGEIVYVNPAALNILTLEREEELLGKSALEFVHPDFVPSVIARFERVFANRRPEPPAEEILIRGDGKPVYAEINGAPMVYNGEPAIQVMISDITQRKLAEEALRESEEKYRALVENQPIGVVIHRRDGEVCFANQSMAKILRHDSPEELVGRHVLEFVAPDRRDVTAGRIRAILDSDAPLSAEEVLTRKDGTKAVAEINGVPTLYQGGPAIQLTVSDISDRKEAEETQRRLEAQLLQSQKMEAVGQLAGGVAHDFNNILTAILGYADLGAVALRAALGPDHETLRTMSAIHQAASRAASLTRQLLTFSRRDITQPEILDLNEIIKGLDNMLRRLITENITLETLLEPELDFVLADAGRIEQIVVNLAVNAVQAMPGGGRMVLETANVDLDEDYATVHPDASAGPHVLLAVSDTGVGIDEATQERIFEPFFTTKALEQGTGLGLSTVHGIVRQAGGSIQVYSELGNGTSLKVYLPALTGAVPPRHETGIDPSSMFGDETVLLAEDDASVRDLTARMLRSAGYTVLEASGGAEAQQLAATHGGPIHLLVADVIMADINGRELSQRLTARMPDLPTLFISGYTSNVIASHGVLEDGVEFLEKPFSVNRLLSRVREILDKHN